MENDLKMAQMLELAGKCLIIAIRTTLKNIK
jgi:hypothetical protein